MSITNYRAHKDRTKKERMQSLFSSMNAEIHRANSEITRLSGVLTTAERHNKILRICLWIAIVGIAAAGIAARVK